MIKALRTVRQYCREHKDCSVCVFDKICSYCDDEDYIPPIYWKLPGDDKGSQVDNDVEIIADIGELNENDD